MKRAVVVMCIVLTLPAFARGEGPHEWTRGEKALAATYAALTVADVFQTSRFKDKGVLEGNPSMAGEDGGPSMGRVVVIKGGVLLGVLLLAHYTPRYRNGILWMAVIGQGAVVGWNLQF